MDHCRKGLKVGKEVKSHDQYNLYNYRQDNKKLMVELPGEKMRLFFEQSPEKQEQIDGRNLEKFLDEIHKDKQQLKKALKMTYDKAAARQQRLEQQQEGAGKHSPLAHSKIGSDLTPSNIKHGTQFKSTANNLNRVGSTVAYS